jgi:hypothetical protein
VIDFGIYFISEWPFLAPEQPSLLLRPPTGFAPNASFENASSDGKSGGERTFVDALRCSERRCRTVGKPVVRVGVASVRRSPLQIAFSKFGLFSAFPSASFVTATDHSA